MATKSKAKSKSKPKTKAKSKKSNAWFKPMRNSYIATNAQGALTTIIFIAYLIILPVILLKSMSSAALALIISVVLWAIGFQVMTAFAKSRS